LFVYYNKLEKDTFHFCFLIFMLKYISEVNYELRLFK